MKTWVIITLISLIILFPQNVFAINVILSGDAEDVIFDGKWTTEREWKQAGITGLGEDNVIRAAHYGDFIYVILDVVNDRTFDKFSDRATICIDSKNEKNKISDENDFCFVVIPGRSEPITLQGGHFTALTGNFKQIPNHPDLIGVVGISDEINRYSKIPHLGYEYRIPIDLIGRSDNYGFYSSVYDYSENRLFANSPTENPLKIPSPTSWSELVSPDKTLPEFQTYFFIVVSLFLLIFLTKIMSKRMNRITFGVNYAR